MHNGHSEESGDHSASTVTADRIITSRPALIAAHGHRQQTRKWCTQKFGENPAVQTAELQVRGTRFCFGGAVPLPHGRRSGLAYLRPLNPIL